MKKIKIILALLSLMSVQLISQNNIILHSGIAAGKMKLSGIEADGIPISNSMQYQLGLSTDIPMRKGWSFEPGIQYAWRGFDIYQGTDIVIAGLPIGVGAGLRTRAQYIEVPLLLKYSFNPTGIRPYFKAGLKPSYLRSTYIKTVADVIVQLEIGRTDINLQASEINRLGIGAQFATGIDIPFGKNKISIEAGYDLGFSDQLQLPIVNLGLRNRSMGLQVRYALHF